MQHGLLRQFPAEGRWLTTGAPAGTFTAAFHGVGEGADAGSDVGRTKQQLLMASVWAFIVSRALIVHRCGAVQQRGSASMRQHNLARSPALRSTSVFAAALPSTSS
jgi:hypothetical protein